MHLKTTLLLLFLQKALTTHYRLIIIKNGYNWKETSRTQVSHDQDEFTKIYTTLLFKTETYKSASLSKTLNSNKIPTIEDSNNWQIQTKNDQIVNHGMSTWSDTIGLELPIKKIDMKIDLNLGNEERRFRIEKRVICDGGNMDRKSEFFFGYYFAKKYVYGNIGFNLFMKEVNLGFIGMFFMWRILRMILNRICLGFLFRLRVIIFLFLMLILNLRLRF